MLTTNARVLVDWDGDGMFNTGVPSGAPDNLVPDPYYAQPSLVRGTTITGHEEPSILPEIVEDISAVSVQHSKVACGGSNAKQVWIGYKWRYCQPLDGDTLSISGATEDKILRDPVLNGYTVNLDLSIKEEKSVYGRIAYPNRMNIGYNGLTNLAQPSSIPVVGGTAYRVNFYTKVRYVDPADLTGAFQFTINGMRAASDVLSTSNFTQTVASGWVKRSVTFTNPANNSYVYFTVPYNSTSIQLSLTGFGIFPSATNPSYVADPALTVAANSFSAQLAANTSYNYSFYVKADSFNNIGVIIKTCDIGGYTWTTRVAETNFTVSGSWVRVNVSFTTGANACGAVVNIIPYVGASPAAAGVTGNIYIRAVQITEGTGIHPFHALASNAYDDITSWVKSVSWKLGKKSIEEPLPYEGTMQLNLNNQDKLFSPKNTASPLYGFLQQNRKVALQIQNPSTGEWTNRWVGWLSTFEATAGLSQSLDAVIQCQQGVFRFREGDYTAPVTPLKRMDEIVENVLKNGAWRSPATALEGVLGFNARVGINAYVNNYPATVNLVETGLNTYAVQGSGWGRKTTTDEALSDVLSAENAGLWIDRDGKLNIVNRNHWVNGSTYYDVNIVADTQVQSADYNYGKNVINKYEVQIVQPTFDTTATVWQTKYARPVKAKGSSKIAMVFSFPEGRIKTVQNVQAATTFHVYLKDPAINPAEPAVTDAFILDNVSVTAVRGNGSRYYLQVDNRNANTVWVQASVSGDALSTSNESTATYFDADSIRITQATHKASKSNPLITDEAQALAVAEFYVGRNALPIGEFDQLKITDKGTQATYDLIYALKQGAVLRISEKQTVETNLVGTVVEESGNISNGVFNYTVALSKMESQGYYQIDGVTQIEPSNAAISAYPVAVHGAQVQERLAYNVPVQEFSTSKIDGHLYFIDKPDTLKTFSLEEVNVTYTDPNVGGTYPYTWVADDAGFPTIMPSLGFKVVWHGNDKKRGNPDVLVTAGDCYMIMMGGFASHFFGGTAIANEKEYRFAIATAKNDLDLSGGNFGIGSELKTWNYNAGVPQKSYAPAVVNTYLGQSDESYGIGQKFVAEVSASGLGVKYVKLVACYPFNYGTGGWKQQYNGNYFSNDNPMFYGMSLVNCSNLNNMPIDSSKSYKFSLWARNADTSVDCSYTVDLLNRYHVVVASQAFTPTKTAISKVEVTLPSGNSFVTARIRKTSGNTEQRNDKIWIYDWALTESSITEVPNPMSLVYI